jgi:hypothetical protein
MMQHHFVYIEIDSLYKTNLRMRCATVNGQENSIAFSPMCCDVDLDSWNLDGISWCRLLNLLDCLASPMSLQCTHGCDQYANISSSSSKMNELFMQLINCIHKK